MKELTSGLIDWVWLNAYWTLSIMQDAHECGLMPTEPLGLCKMPMLMGHRLLVTPPPRAQDRKWTFMKIRDTCYFCAEERQHAVRDHPHLCRMFQWFLHVRASTHVHMTGVWYARWHTLAPTFVIIERNVGNNTVKLGQTNLTPTLWDLPPVTLTMDLI